MKIVNFRHALNAPVPDVIQHELWLHHCHQEAHHCRLVVAREDMCDRNLQPHNARSGELSPVKSVPTLSGCRLNNGIVAGLAMMWLQIDYKKTEFGRTRFTRHDVFLGAPKPTEIKANIAELS